jgi:hypothetical protein
VIKISIKWADWLSNQLITTIVFYANNYTKSWCSVIKKNESCGFVIKSQQLVVLSDKISNCGDEGVRHEGSMQESEDMTVRM